MLDYDVLRGAYDIHVHAAPDVVPRSRDMVTLFREAAAAGMAGILFKDHCFPTDAAAFVLNATHDTPTRAFGAMALNVTLGGLNPLAVEGALREGVDMVYFPTYSTGPHLLKLGRRLLPMPLPKSDFEGIGIRDAAGAMLPEVDAILDLVREYDAVLATGHLSAGETLLLVERAASRRLPRVLVTHASEAVPGLSVHEQKRAVEMGAMIEHCFLAAAPPAGPATAPDSVPIAEIVRQIQEIGAAHIVLSSDYGKARLPPPVEGFRRALEEAVAAGLTIGELDCVVRRNPHRLLVDGRLRDD